MIGALAGAGGLLLIVYTAADSGPAAAYLSFIGALCVWGWHELAFLTGAVAGTRRKHASGARGWTRFREGTAAVIHHEIALAATALLLLSLSWGEPNQTGAAAFALLFALRLSAKLNIFWASRTSAMNCCRFIWLI
jgi:putative photosynthetic complex assembly protein 2